MTQHAHVPGETIGVLVMEYGEPLRYDEIPDYIRMHYGGRTPPPNDIALVQEQFRRVWGDTPPTVSFPRQITDALAAALEQAAPGAYVVTLGARHWKPSLAEGVIELSQRGMRRVVALPLSPHSSIMAIRDYTKTLEQAAIHCVQPFHIQMIEQWYDLPGLIETFVEHIHTTLDTFAPTIRNDVVAVFCAHSVPESMRKQEHHYVEQLSISSALVAERAGLATWHMAYHSGQGPGQWLGPDIIALLDQLHQQNHQHVLAVPIGAVYDNVELLYEFDIQAAEYAQQLGMTLTRVPIPNTHPTFINSLAQLVMTRAQNYDEYLEE